MFAAKHPNVIHRSYVSQVEGERSTTIPHEGVGNIQMDYKIKVEILNTQLYRSRAQITNGVGEIPENERVYP